MIRHFFVVFLAATSAHAEQQADFAFGMPLSPGGPGAFQRAAIPAAVYEGVAKRDLADLRVFNADGELVPFAWVPRPASVHERPPAVALPMFPLYADRERRDVAGLALTVVRNAAGTTIDIKSGERQPATGRELGGYVLDTSALAEPLTALLFALPPSAGAPTMRLRLDASDDLAEWRSIASDATLVNLESEGRRLTRDRIDIVPTTAKYLRVSWTVGRPAIEFTGVSGEYGERNVEAAREWREAAALPVADRDGEFEYDLGGAFPVDRIGIVLAEPNSILPVQLLARAAPAEPWQAVSSTVFYRLSQPGGDVTSGPVAVVGGERRYWLLRFDPRAGGTARTAPRLRVGWQPQEIVFVARGPAPFMLAYGSRVAKPGTLPIETLVPGYDRAKGLAPDVAAAHTGPPMKLGGPDRLRDPPDVKRWALWASLALGALVLGWMAWRLSREIGMAPSPEADQAKAPPD